MPDITSNTVEGSTGAKLDSAPPRPPSSRNGKSVMDLAMGDESTEGLGMESQNPLIQTMMAMGETKNALLKLSSQLPALQPGIQQFIMGLEQVVPQMLADLVSGQTPGSTTGASPLSNQAPTAPMAST